MSMTSCQSGFGSPKHCFSATPREQAQRAEMLLRTADDVPSSEIVRRVRTSYPTLTRWRKRFEKPGAVQGRLPR